MMVSKKLQALMCLALLSSSALSAAVAHDDLIAQETAKREAQEKVKKDFERKDQLENCILMPDKAYQAIEDNFGPKTANFSLKIASNMQWGCVWAASGFLTQLSSKVFKETVGKLNSSLMNILFYPSCVSKVGAPKGLELDNLILPADVRSKLEIAVHKLKNIIKRPGRAKFKGMLFYGAPGTGKTKAAQTIASMTGLHYLEINGSKLATAKKDEVSRLIQCLTWREMFGIQKPTIVFIDECESFLKQRSEDDANNPLLEWLNFTSEPHPYIQFIYATNHKDRLDDAMERRATGVEFKLPEEEGRVLLLEHYFNDLFLADDEYTDEQKAWMSDVFSHDFFIEIARKLVYTKGSGNDAEAVETINVFSPDNIQGLMIAVKDTSGSTDDGLPTRELFEQEVESACQEKAKSQEAKQKAAPHSDTPRIIARPQVSPTPRVLVQH